ncbi:hypothetical protein KC19_VG031600 [Ceratodon purpureus]|uniref:Uncharacterized protein n=1 Tax=Ceratodon purpureus TaxID=3225 RepID=A0A8T0HLW4_CERPU|nr:hypothetical protein KC19_VG031600 [Ceratodon purpureus]
MDELGYQHLLSKCIQNGFSGGVHLKFNSVLQGKVEPALGTTRLLENSMSDFREDTSGAAEGPAAESVPGHRLVTGMDGTAMDKPRSSLFVTPNSAGIAHTRGRALWSEDSKVDGLRRSFLKSRVMVTKTPASKSIFSFRNLLEGAINDSGIKPPTIVQNMTESGMRSVSKVEPQKDCVSGERYPPDESLVRERQDVVGGKMVPQSRRDEKVHNAEGVLKSWEGEEYLALRVCDSGSLSGDTVVDRGPHVSYFSLLQAQLGDVADKVRTENPQRTVGSSLLDVGAHSSLLNLQLQATEVEGGFMSSLENSVPFFPSVARRASFPAGDSVSVGEQSSDINELSRAFAAVDSRFAEKVLNGVAIDSSEAVEVSTPTVPISSDENVARALITVDRLTLMVADSVSTDERISGTQVTEELSCTFGTDESRSAGNALNRDILELSEAAAVVPESFVCTRNDDTDLLAGLESSSCVVASPTCSDEIGSSGQVLDGLARDFALGESQSAGFVAERDVIVSSEAAALAVPSVPSLTEGNDSRVEGVVAGLMDSGEEMFDVVFLDQPSHAFDGSRSVGNVFIGSLQGAVGSASPLSMMIGEDVSMVEVMVEKEVDNCGGVTVDIGQGRITVRSFNPSNGQVLVERIRCPPSLGMMTVKDRLEHQADHVHAGTSLDLPFQASQKEMDANEDNVGGPESNVYDTPIDCVVGNVSETCNIVSSAATVSLSVEGNISSQNEHVVASCDQNLRPEELRDTSTVVECFRQAALKETENDTVVLIEERKDEISGARMSFPSGNVPLKSNPAFNVTEVVLEKDSDDLNSNALIENSLSVISPSNGHFVMEGSHPTPEYSGSRSFCSEGMCEPKDAVVVYVDPMHADGGDDMVSLTKKRSEQDCMLGRPAGLCEVAKLSGAEQCKASALADVAPETQIVQFSESQAVNMGLVLCGTGHTSDGFTSSWLPLCEADMQNKVERVLESHVGEIVNGATDSGNSIERADQILSTNPNAVADGLRQVFLRDSDTTISDSVESPQATGAERIAGKEVQSLLVTKFKGRVVRHLDDLEDNHIIHLGGLGNPRTRHLDENEEQPYASPLNGIVHDQLPGAEARPYKKKARARAYSYEKATRGTGRSYFHRLGSDRNSQWQDAGNRCRRNRHIYPDQPVPVFIEGRDEGFDEADGGSFLRWLTHQDEANPVPPLALGKRVRKHGEELVKSMIAIPSFRVLSDYEEKQQEVEKKRKNRMQLQPLASSRPTFVSSSTVQPSEYDMDDEDERWLHAWNKRLARNGSKQSMSEDKFEEMIEYFERRSAEMIVSAARVFPGFPHSGKCLAQPLGVGFLPRTCPLGLGSLSTNPATLGTPVSGYSPTLTASTLQPGGHSLVNGFRNVLSSKRHVTVSSSIRVDSNRSASSPTSMGRDHTLISENERNPSNSVEDAICERPSDGSLRKSFEASALENECCICNGGEDDENNPVYTCKRCLIHVHQSCYGIREKFRDDGGRVIAPSNWCCRKCEAVAVGRAQPNVSCALCRKRGGALKPTVIAQKWAHIACALYTNETFFVDPDAMEPIDGIAAVTARVQQRQERCRLCGVKKGICSLCAVKDCRAPFHVSCGVSQGASFELRQSKQKVVGVRSFCPRHGRTTANDSAPSAELKDRHMLSSSSTSGATPSATASGSISTASSMDDKVVWSPRQSISHLDESCGQPAELAKNVGTDVAGLMDNIMSMNGDGVEDAGRVLPKGIRFTLKRKWNESCDQVSEDGLLSDCQKRCGDGREVSGGHGEALGSISTWQVVEPDQKLKKIKFKFGRLAQSLDLESSLMLAHQEMVGSEVPQAGKVKDVVAAVGEVCGDSGIYEKDAEFLKGFSEDSFAKEIDELMILEDAMKSGVAPGHVMREAFVYWRAKRAEFEGSLLCELHHEQWLRSQGIFNKDASDEERVASGKMMSLLRVPEAQQPSSMSNTKTLEMAKEIRMQLESVRSMAQMVVQREKLKYNYQFVLGSIASARLNRAPGVSEDRHCVWCPSIKTLLQCGTCSRSFCFNCFKHRKGFGVKGWMTAMKQPIYICKYCQELSNEVAHFSKLDPALTKIGEDMAVSIPGDMIGVARSTPMITNEAVLRVVSTSVTPSIHVCDGRKNGAGKERGEGGSWYSPGSGSLREAERVVTATVTKNVDVTEGRGKNLEIGHSKVISRTGTENARRGIFRRSPEVSQWNLCKPSHLQDGLNKFLSSAHRRMDHSSFETTLRRLKILQFTNIDPQQELITSSNERSFASIATRPITDVMEVVTPNMTIGSNVPVPSTPGSGPALLVYKKRRLILGEGSESPPSAYDFGDQPSSPTLLEIGTSIYKITPPRRRAVGDGAASD